MFTNYSKPYAELPIQIFISGSSWFVLNAIKANNKFIEYIRKLKPKDLTMELYEEIINDLRKSNSKDRLKEIRALQTEILKEEER